MGRIKVKYDLLLFVLLMVILFLPIIQEWTGVFPVKPLNGVFLPTTKPELTFESYKTNTYQAQIDKYSSENFGLREPILRLYNQYLWDVFRKTYVSKEQIVFGKDRWFYEPGSVSDHEQRLFRYYAADSTQMASMLSKEAQKLLHLQQILETHGVHLFVCLVPAKDLIYPEYIPENHDTTYQGTPKISARFYNEDDFTRLGINHLNLEQWFLQIKDTADFALFPQTGMHWSKYAALLSADTLIRYMEHLGGMNIKNLVIGPREYDKARRPDGDLEDLLNLMRPVRKPKYCYADCMTDGDATATKPKIIVIGDSFWWTIADQLPLKEIFSRAPYWYYNNTIYYDDRYNSLDELDLAEELLSSDFVVLSYCATQQYRMNDGFTQKALKALGVKDSDAIMDSASFIEREIQRTIADILASPKSMESMREKAKQFNKTVEKAVRDDAKWIVNYKIQNGTLNWPKHEDYIAMDSATFIECEIQRTIESLKSNPEAMQSIREKATKYNKTLDKALRDDALWVVNHKIQQGTLKWPVNNNDINPKPESHGIQQ